MLTALQASITCCVEVKAFILKVTAGAPEARIRVNVLSFRLKRKKIWATNRWMISRLSRFDMSRTMTTFEPASAKQRKTKKIIYGSLRKNNNNHETRVEEI